MRYFATASGPKVRDAMTAGLIGQVITYKVGNKLTEGAAFIIDAGTVSIVDGRPVNDPDWSSERWLANLHAHADKPGLLFAVCPDWVLDARLTNERWARWHGAIRNLGIKAAYVIQNGCTSIPASAQVVFIGGDDDFKDGPQAASLVAEAKRRGLHVHCGRVNTRRRLRHTALIGCDSADGTTLAFGPDKNLPQLLGWLYSDRPNLWGVG